MSVTQAIKTTVKKEFKPKVAAISEKSTTVGSDRLEGYNPDGDPFTISKPTAKMCI